VALYSGSCATIYTRKVVDVESVSALPCSAVLCRSGHICRSRLSATYLSSYRRCLLIAMTSRMTRYACVAQPANLSPIHNSCRILEREEAWVLLQSYALCGFSLPYCRTLASPVI